MNDAIGWIGRCAVVAGLMAIAGCKGGTAAAATEPPSTAAPAPVIEVTAAGPSAAPAAAAPSAPAPGPMTLMGRLAAEAQSRPPLKPGADDVMSAFAAVGAEVTRAGQSLGSTYHARYCRGGYVANETLAVNVCEFTDEAAAAAGLEYAKSIFPGMKTRQVWAHKATTLTIIEEKADPKATALEQRMAAKYASL